MDLTPIFITGIIFCALYKTIELFVRRRERIMLIEKINPETSGNIDVSKISGLLNPASDSRFTALKWGMLAVGLGAGLVISSMIIIDTPMLRDMWQTRTSLIGSLTLLGGGLGLVIAFIIEMAIRKSENKSKSEE